MALCGMVPQTKEIRFKALDNRKRTNAIVTTLVHLGQNDFYLPVVETDQFVYEFGFSHSERGVAILEIFIDGVQIPDSPVRVDIISRDCDDDFPGQLMTAVSAVVHTIHRLDCIELPIPFSLMLSLDGQRCM